MAETISDAKAAEILRKHNLPDNFSGRQCFLLGYAEGRASKKYSKKYEVD